LQCHDSRGREGDEVDSSSLADKTVRIKKYRGAEQVF